MIAYVNGIVESITMDNAVIDVNGIGYNVCISSDTAARLPGIGEQAKLYTYTCVREDAFLLYGFLSRDDLDIFKKCISVNGIGPKGALAILSVMDSESLRFAICSGDVKAISKAPGIGARTAERLILELKDKIKIDDAMIDNEIAAHQKANAFHSNPQIEEAVTALVALGYGRSESLKAVNAVENASELDSGALLKAALKKMF